ncbi:MAG: alpha-ketoglutarate-dependent dioxygenase AlkB, partial [Acidobacteriota bacterium]|nr:alpha-ketoglutarate-dependent dioxygenase AlkB [Acidobacteriota bacterium]
GLVYKPGFLSLREQKMLLHQVDALPRLSDLKRRVQHYGYKYDYKARAIDHRMRIGDLPPWAQALGERLIDEAGLPALPDQLIINEYQPGQGISAHTDCVPCFDSHIESLSLPQFTVIP